VIGCPHVSNDEVKQIAMALKGKKVNSSVKMWILCPAMVREFAVRNGYADMIAEAGALLVTDTCPVVMTPGTLQNLGFHTLATNSAKLVNCMPGGGRRIHYGDVDRLVQAAVTGKWGEYHG